RVLLPNAAVNANYVAALLVEDGVEDDGGLAGLPVADDQLALPAPDGNHGVDGLDAGLQRLANRLAVQHTRRDALQWIALLRGNRALAVYRLAERIDHAAYQLLANGYGHNGVRAEERRVGEGWRSREGGS